MSDLDEPELAPQIVVDVDDAWDSLRQHLTWTRGASSVVFLLSDNRGAVREIDELCGVYAKQYNVKLTRLDITAGDDPHQIVRSALPGDGIAWITAAPIDDLDAWRSILHALNELRTTLSRSFQGSVIIAGPVAIGRLAARQAQDLWSVRSLVRVVGTAPPQPTIGERSLATERSIEAVATPEPMTFAFTTILVPFDERTANTSADLLALRRATSSAATGNIAEARRHLAQVGPPTADDERGFSCDLISFARAELAVADDDYPSASVLLDGLIGHTVWELLRQPVLRLRGEIASRFGEWDVAERVAEQSLGLARTLAERDETSDAVRDLTISLDNVGGVAEALGDWNRAAQAYDESLQSRRTLAERNNTTQALRDLSVSLRYVVDVAEALSDWNRAAQAYDESLQLARTLAERNNTPRSLRDLSISLNNVARAASATGDEAAAAAYTAEAQLLGAPA